VPSSRASDKALVITLFGLYVPAAIERESARFGLIGVAFVLVSLLVVLGVLLVSAAVLSAEIARTDGRPGSAVTPGASRRPSAEPARGDTTDRSAGRERKPK
jgi:membrane protein